MKALAPVLAVVAVVAAVAAALGLWLAGPPPELPLDPTVRTAEPAPVTSLAPVTPPDTGDPAARVATPRAFDPSTLRSPTPANPRGAGAPGFDRASRRNTGRQPTIESVGKRLDDLERGARVGDGNAIQQAIDSLLARGAEAVPDVIDALERAAIENRGLRKQLVYVLQKLDDPRGAQALQALALDTGDPDMEIRKMAALSLGQMSPAHGVPALRAIVDQPGDPGVVGPVREYAVQALGLAGGDEAREVLHRLTREEADVNVRRQAVGQLHRFPGPETVDLLLDVARTERDQSVRGFAIQVLGQSDDPRARPQLAAMLSDWPGQTDRQVLYESLQRKPDPSTADAVRRALGSETNAIMIKRAAGTLFAVLGPDGKAEFETLHDRYRSNPELAPFFEHMLRQYDARASGGEPTPPAPPGQPK